MAMRIAIFLFGLTLPAVAGLEFKSRVQEFDADAGTETVEARFEFVNRGSRPVTIEKIDSSCGCLKAEAAKSTYQPGESGVIDAEFEIRGLAGEIEKTLTVLTDDPENPSIRLAVKVDVPLLIVVEPKMLSWTVGEEPVTKAITFRVMRDAPIRITGIQVSRTNFSGEVKTIKDGEVYHIELTPTSTAETMLGVVSIETDCKVEEQARQLGFYRIQSVEQASRPDEDE